MIAIPGITAIMLSYVQDIYPDKHRDLGMGIYMAATSFATYHLAKPLFNLSSGELENLFLVLFIGVFVSPIAGKYSDTIGRVKILFFGILVLIIGILLSMMSRRRLSSFIQA